MDHVESSDTGDFSVHPLCPPTAVVGSASGVFRNGRREVAIATCECVFLYKAQDTELALVASMRPGAHITSLHAFSSPDRNTAEDGLLVTTRSGRILHFLWCQQLQNFQEGRCSFRAFSAPAGRPLQTLGDAPLVAQADFYCPTDSHSLNSSTYKLVATNTGRQAPEMHMMANDAHLAHRLQPSQGPDDWAEAGFESAISMCLMVVPELTHNILLAVLSCQDGEKTLRVMRATTKSTATRETMARGPPKWCTVSRNPVWLSHPDATLLFPAFTPLRSDGVFLQLGTREAVLVSCLAIKKEAATAALDLRAPPTCATAVDDATVVVGDVAGGIAILRFSTDSQKMTATSLQCERPQMLLTSLAVIPSGAPEELLLFVGSWGSPSQLISVRRPQLEEGQLQPAPFEDSLAPIHDAVRFQELTDSGEGCLLMCCGLAPGGSVCLGRMAAALIPCSQGGPKLELRPKLSAVSFGDLTDPHGVALDVSLVLSFESANRTMLLDVRGADFREFQAVGMDLDSASLLVACCPCGCLLQVTPKEVRLGPPVFKRGAEGSSAVTWKPEKAISMAAYQPEAVTAAIVTGSRVHILMAGWPKGLLPQRILTFPEQISAVSLFSLQSAKHSSQAGPPLWLAIGQWKTNSVLLQPVDGSDEQATATVDVRQGQPRSLLVCRLSDSGSGGDDSLFLFVGTADGSLVYYLLEVGIAGISVGESRHVRVGLGGVDLEWVAGVCGNPTHLFASCEQAILVTQRQGALYQNSPCALDSLDFMRVHGSEGALSSCSLHTQELQGMRAWVAASGRLTVGALDFNLKLRCHRKVIGYTPQRVLFHQRTGSALVVAEDATGSAWLHLLHTTSLQKLAAVEMRGLRVTAMCWARLAGSRQVQQLAVLASLREYTDEVGLRREQSQLHVVEIALGTLEVGKLRYELLLLGSMELDSACFSLAVVPDEGDDKEATSATLKAQQHSSSRRTHKRDLVVAGCVSGVHLFRLAVRPGDAQSALENAAAQIEGEAAALVSGGATSRAEPPGLSGQHLAAAASKESGSVMHLSTHGHSVFACDLFASVTHFLVRSACEVSVQSRLSRSAADTRCRGSVCAVFAISNVHALGGLFPFGLILLSRDQEEEEGLWNAHRDVLDLAREQGQKLSQESVEQPPMAELHCRAFRGFTKVVTQLCPGHLNLRYFAGESTSGADVSKQEGSCPKSGGEGREPVIYVTREGAVGLLQPWSPSELEVLHQALKSALEGCGEDVGCTLEWVGSAGDAQQVLDCSVRTLLGSADWSLDAATRLERMQPHNLSACRADHRAAILRAINSCRGL